MSLLEGTVHVLQHTAVGGCLVGARFVELAKNAHRPLHNGVEHVLVVLIVHKLPLHLLGDVCLLLELEDVLDEEVVQLLVGEVNAQLRKGVRRPDKT